ncbi:MAG TPA: P1 family peptidase [Candidatus Methylomirabilis sp.]|nr:P1 family peptidase [Candidatus Methylomirabilis sp.]
MTESLSRPRARDLGLVAGDLPTGSGNAITDVAGVRVGHATLISGDGPLRPGEGPVRTGVTVILPHGDNLYRQKVRGAVHTINGFGKACGFEEVRELGVIEAPIAFTGTLNVGLVADAVVQYAVRQSPEIGVRTSSVNVVVGECSDGFLNDLQGRHVRAEHVWAALESATAGPVQEGVVGAGTGTSCFGWKGGIGTASRVVPPESGGFTVGALVQSNFGRPRDLVVFGVPVGRQLQPPGPSGPPPAERGSAMIVLATDAPLSSRQLHRLCVRAAAGLVRTGSHHGHGSGDFVIAFSTATRIEHAPASITTTQTVLADEPRAMAWLFPAVVESVEEAVLNSLTRAETVVGRDGNTRHALPIAEVVELVRRFRPAANSAP